MMQQSITVAYLEDDPIQSSTVAHWLEKQGMRCYSFGTNEQMLDALSTCSFDAIMLDVEIHGEESGLTMLQHIRETVSTEIPILMVSAKTYWQEALKGGADDFLEKPLSSKKLLVHLHRLLRPVGEVATIENYPPFQLNTTQQQFTIKGDRVELSQDEYELASTLFRHFGKVLSYEQLTDKLAQKGANPSTRVIEQDLRKLQRKMDLRNINGWRLESVYRHGCRLVNEQYDLAAP